MRSKGRTNTLVHDDLRHIKQTKPREKVKHNQKDQEPRSIEGTKEPRTRNQKDEEPKIENQETSVSSKGPPKNCSHLRASQGLVDHWVHATLNLPGGDLFDEGPLLVEVAHLHVLQFYIKHIVYASCRRTHTYATMCVYARTPWTCSTTVHQGCLDSDPNAATQRLTTSLTHWAP